jgi:hypothetical protein
MDEVKRATEKSHQDRQARREIHPPPVDFLVYGTPH